MGDSRSAHLDAGLLAMAHDQSREAADSADSELASMALPPDGMAAVVDEAVAAENNLAVCQLHACKLREAVQRLEDFVRRDPVLYLQDSLAKTMSGLYEFLPDSKERRAVIRELVEAYQLGDMDASAFGG